MNKHIFGSCGVLTRYGLPVAAGTLLLATIFTVRAQQIAYEGFDYLADTQLFGNSGGYGWATPWSAAGTSITTNSSSGLSFGTLPATGGGLVVGYPFGYPTSGGQTANAQRLLPDTAGNLAASSSGRMWISFLYQNWNTDQAGLPGFREAKFILFSGATTNATGNANVNGTERLDVGSPNTYSAGASDTLTLWQGSTYSSSGIPTPRGNFPTTTVFVLMRLDVDASTAADTAYAWFSPSLISEPDTSSAVSFNLQDLSGVNAVRFQAGNLNSNGTNAVFKVDELRIGHTFADVITVPEPSTIILMVLGGLALLVLRPKQ